MKHSDKITDAVKSAIIQPGEWWIAPIGFSNYLVGMHGELISLLNKPKKLLPSRKGEYTGFRIVDDNGNLQTRYLHRLVAEVAYGNCPDGMECCHTDGNKRNNNALNLRWDTHKANENDKINRPKGRNHPMAKWSDDEIFEVRRRHQNGETQASIAKLFGMSPMNVSRIVNRKLWGHI